MNPKRMMVAIYYGTQTLENIEKDQAFVLQILEKSQYNLVSLLGKQTGKKIDKMIRLHKRNLLSNWDDYKILTGALSVMKLTVCNTMDAGDHKIFLCDVENYKNLNEGETLTTQILNEKGIIRI